MSRMILIQFLCIHILRMIYRTKNEVFESERQTKATNSYNKTIKRPVALQYIKIYLKFRII